MKHTDTYIRKWLVSRKLALIYFFVYSTLLFAVYGLYGYKWGTAWYVCLFGGVIGLGFASYDFAKFRAKAIDLQKLPGRFPLGSLPRQDDAMDTLYQEIILQLEKERIQVSNQSEQLQKQSEEYYTLWAHQIKTPISAMRLLLQYQQKQDGFRVYSDLEQELFKIEQYVEMVLQYQRLTSFSSDLTFTEHTLTVLVKKAAKNLAPLFIYKNLSFELGDLPAVIVTDEKWFVFVVEQILTNAIKYTQSGTMRIYQQEGPVLAISDTGIGIAKEDVSRVFERGFTGGIGRTERASTGIGLFLCKEIVSQLGFGIQLTSEKGKGTTVFLDLQQERVKMY